MSQGVYHEAIFHLYQVQLVWTELPGGSLNFQSGFCFGGYTSCRAPDCRALCVYLNRKIRAWEDQCPEQRFSKNWLRHQRLHSSNILTVQQSHVVRTKTFHPLALDYAGCVHCVFQTCLSESYKNKGGVLVVNAFTFTHCALQQPSPGYFNFWNFFLQINPTHTFLNWLHWMSYYDVLTL